MYIGVVPIRGNITQRSYSSMQHVLEYIEKKDKVRAVLIYINSGGGEAVASELFYNHLLQISKKKPVYSYIEGMGASGAYWVSLAGSRIYAFSGSVIGSIGVLSILPNVSRLLDKLGVDIESLKIGEYKDSLLPFSKSTEKGKEMINKIMKESYDHFVSVVSERRNIQKSKLKSIAQGQVFSVSEAVNNGLIDSTGTFSAVIDDLSTKISGLKKTKIMVPPKPFFQRMIENSTGQTILENIASVLDRFS